MIYFSLEIPGAPLGQSPPRLYANSPRIQEFLFEQIYFLLLRCLFFSQLMIAHNKTERLSCSRMMSRCADELKVEKRGSGVE
ncbi:hypothetical protein QQF64_007512 [Cirrhinus molitorella]|uniref:Uncharacterized protein n=1 Tax=Cirrhinus molitorella TaxID=172907 RepID=A0ABR3MAT1_9TELE